VLKPILKRCALTIRTFCTSKSPDGSRQSLKPHSDFEKLYAEDPEYEDVAKRLGL